MIYELYAIKDTLAGEFGAPQPFKNRAIAERWFGEVMASKPTLAKDCELWKVGTVNVEDCVITSEIEFIKTGVTSL